jgi:hypothetical protein
VQSRIGSSYVWPWRVVVPPTCSSCDIEGKALKVCSKCIGVILRLAGQAKQDVHASVALYLPSCYYTLSRAIGLEVGLAKLVARIHAVCEGGGATH